MAINRKLLVLIICILLMSCEKKEQDLIGTWLFDTDKYLQSPDMAANLSSLGFTPEDIMRGVNGDLVIYDDEVINLAYTLLVQQTAELSMSELSFFDDNTLVIKLYIGDLDKIYVQVAKYREIENHGSRHSLCLFDNKDNYICCHDIILEENCLRLDENEATLFFVRESN